MRPTWPAAWIHTCLGTVCMYLRIDGVGSFFWSKGEGCIPVNLIDPSPFTVLERSITVQHYCMG